MDDRALIQQQLILSHQLLKRTLSDISDEDAHQIPEPTLSPIVWQAGHQAFVNFNFAGRSGSRSGLPETYDALFATGTGGNADYPPLSRVVKVLDDSHEALMRSVTEADLSTPNQGPFGAWKNFAEMFAFSSGHCWYHIGKITTLRALLGKPRLFG
jgi:DinB family protein